MPKIYFSGFIEVDELPDDLGSAQLWVVNSITEAVEKNNSMTDEEASKYDYGDSLIGRLNLEIT